MRLVHRLGAAEKLMAAAGCSIAVLLLLASGLIAMRANDVVRSMSRHDSAMAAQVAAAQTVKELERIESAGRAMAAAIGAAYEQGVRDRAQLVQILRAQAETQSPEVVLGSWFIARPNAIDGLDAAMAGRADIGSTAGTGRFMPYWVRMNGQLELQPLNGDSDYRRVYFTASANSGRPMIVEPFSYRLGKRDLLLTSLTFPVVVDGRLIGVAGVDLTLDELSRRLNAIRPSDSGRVMLLSSAMKWVSHPEPTRRMNAYDGPGAALVRQALARGEAMCIPDVADSRGALDRLVVPIRLDGLNASWGLVVDMPVAAMQRPARNLSLALLAVGILALAAVLAALFATTRRFVKRPLAELAAAVGLMSRGIYDQPIAGTGDDEIGRVASALDDFRLQLAAARDRQAVHEAEDRRREAEERERLRQDEAERVEAERRQLQANAEAERRAALQATADALEQRVLATVQLLASASSAMQQAASDMARSAERTKAEALSATATTRQTATSVQMVASATDELATSIAEISNQVEGAARTSEIVNVRAREATEHVASLSLAADEIGSISALIAQVAKQTNLLALNATIEAARAGTAGRGFAVVASEVKALAREAARATEDIVRRTEAIRTVSKEVADAIERVRLGIDALTRSAAMVAAAVKQQSQSTMEISHNLQQAADGTDHLRRNVIGVDEHAEVTNHSAAVVLGTTEALDRHAATLRQEIIDFINRVRAA